MPPATACGRCIRAIWYLAGTEECRLQDWDNPGNQPPGRSVGSFVLKDGAPAFVPAPAAN